MFKYLMLSIIFISIIGCGEDAPISSEPIDTGSDYTENPGLIDTTYKIDTSNANDSEETDNSFSENLASILAEEDYEGMVNVNAAGSYVTIGDSAVSGSGEDDGAIGMFKTMFNYDFYIDEDEVTQGEFYAVMGDSSSYPPSYGLNNGWTKMSQPVGNVSLYQAIVFCNNKSVLKGLESVYTVNGTDDAFTVDIDYNKNGFALPTDGEWEYVAKNIIEAAVENPKTSAYSVFGSKSEPSVKKASTPIANIYNFYGNVREIVLTNYEIHSEDSLYNYGIQDFSTASGEKYSVRGGSYKSDIVKLSASIRQKISITNNLEDVGFRCVRRIGAIDKEMNLFAYHMEKEIEEIEEIEIIETVDTVSTEE